MSNIPNIFGWKKDLCITVHSGALKGRNLDFNRLLHLNCPSTKELQSGKKLGLAKRSDFIIQLKEYFDLKILEGGSIPTLSSLYGEAQNYLKWVDSHCESSFTRISLKKYAEHHLERQRRMEIKKTRYMQIRTQLVMLFTPLELPSEWFDDVPSMLSDDNQPFEGYSRSDLNKLLPLLRAIFKQISTQFLADPIKQKTAYRTSNSMIFHWQGKTLKILGAISKMMTAATYLLAYYTYANTSTLFALSRPKTTGLSLQDRWFTMPAFKRRAFKMIDIEMGEHHVNVPKYSMMFFDKLLEVSAILDTSNDALLLQTIDEKLLITPMKSTVLQGFCLWLNKIFKLTDLRGRPLRPVISRFRETGAQLSEYQGDLAKSILLENTPNVRKKHYSTGNRLDNQGMTQDTALIRQYQASSKSSAKEAQSELNIDVLTIEQVQRAHTQISRTANGGLCSNPFGDESKAFIRRAELHQLAHGDKLACTELLKCFGCQHQVIVQSVSDIWCLLSFKECVEESLYLHINADHYKKNFSRVVEFIEQIILPKVDKKIIEKANVILNDKGRHPLWLESDSLVPYVNAPKLNGVKE